MATNLVIVESPAKAKTIEKFLGKDFKVMSSMGHIRDLEGKGLCIDIKNNFLPEYAISKDKKQLVAELKKEAKKADLVWLASDEDREGEAISWHLKEVLGIDEKKLRRIVFHEITKSAILNAIENPRSIDINLVNAQQARRVLDRIVGFEVSPVLWKKIRPQLSAGRVQSVAVRLIVEREREIAQFQEESSYKVVALFKVKNEAGKLIDLKAELQRRLKSKEEAMTFLESCKDATFEVESVMLKPVKRSPAAPFTTSTLQQEAARKLGFSVNQTMRLAQSLYESGHITYMRTDSVNLSSLAINTAKQEIIAMAGEDYSKVRQYHTNSKGAQEAHEAIRPTYMNNHTIEGNRQEQRLYELIWKRTIASQMTDAEIERTTVCIGISNSKEKFIVSGEVLKFDGFLKVYLESTDEEEDNNEESMLPPLLEGDVLTWKEIIAQERFSQQPARYTEASLVKKMEELGIGRPSTYAPTISTIQKRGYVEKGDKEGEPRIYNILSIDDKNNLSDLNKTELKGKDKGKLMPTDTGLVVTDFLMESFEKILDYNFTASVEKDFDEIAEGKIEWTNSLDLFYKDFHPHVEAAENISQGHKVGERILGLDPKTNRQISVKIGRFGPVAQIGVATDDEKPLFASLRKNQSIETITLEEVLDLFKLPRNLGQYEEKDVKVAVGRFGPYIQHDGKFVSLPKEEDPMIVSLERAIELIEQKREEDKNRLIKSFEEEPELQILNGRFGPYIVYKKKNYKIPKTVEAKDLTIEDCKKYIEQDQKGSGRKSVSTKNKRTKK
jgi:DNA topoisomerase-1